MNILRNSVISVAENPSLAAGKYRVVDIAFDDQIIYLFAMRQVNESAKPVLYSLSDFNCLLEDDVVDIVSDQLPREMQLTDDKLSSENVKMRDERYALIKNLVEDPQFLKTFCISRRSRIVIEHASIQNVRALQIYRLLKKYWEFGQVPNALLNFTSNFGGRGKDKSCSIKQRGRPINKGVYFLRKKVSVNVTDEDKVNIAEAVRIELKKSKKITYTKAHETYKKLFCELETAYAYAEGRPLQIVSYDQFKYWAKKLISRSEMISSQMSDSAYRKDHVGSLSSVNDRFVAPGMRYEIDSTTADVYVVCDVARQRVLGRPTVYSVVDVASRMIVGLHVSMEYASWNAARQALFNACMSKVSYCKRYGINISERDWPCMGVSATLMADRAEMLGENAFNHALRVGTQLMIAPTARGDVKSIVERRFGILNEEIHFLPGTTLGELRKRGEPDYRLDAAITLNAFTKILIEKVLEHNNVDTFNDILTKDLIQADLAAKPLHYWNFYTSRFQCALKAYSENHFVSLLLKKGEANVTREGIVFRGLRYGCQKAMDEDWVTRALQSGAWTVECRHDEAWSTDIYIREPNGKEFIKCELLPAHRIYANLPEAEVVFIKEWKKAKSEEPERDHHRAQRARRTEEIIEQEKKLTAAASRGVSKRAKIVNIHENRRAHLESQKPTLPPLQNDNISDSNKPVDNSEKMRKLFESARERRD